MQLKDLASRGRRCRIVAAGVAVTLFAGAVVAAAEGDSPFGNFGGGTDVTPGNLLIARSVFATPSITAGALVTGPTGVTGLTGGTQLPRMHDR